MRNNATVVAACALLGGIFVKHAAAQMPPPKAPQAAPAAAASMPVERDAVSLANLALGDKRTVSTFPQADDAGNTLTQTALDRNYTTVRLVLEHKL